MSALDESIEEIRKNDRQWEAFQALGDCVVLAPPGSGKTKLLAARIAHDLVNVIHPPRGAACITLTNAAAFELKHRVSTLGVRYRPTLFLGTVHAFALSRILLPYGKACGLIADSGLRIATTKDLQAAMKVAMTEWPRHRDSRNVESTIKKMRKLLASDDEWKRVGKDVRDASSRFVVALKNMGVVDFDGVIEQAVQLVENYPSIRRALVARYSYLYIDEYQDLAPGINRLVEALCFGGQPNTTLFAVGDPEQAIFGWTGTRPELIRQMATRDGVHPVTLRINYRSGDGIINVAARVTGSKREVDATKTGGHVEVHYCPLGLRQQRQWAAARAATLMKDGVALEEVAIVVGTNAEASEVALELSASGIPYYLRKMDYPDTAATRFVEAASAWIVAPADGGVSLGQLLRDWRALLAQSGSRAADVSLVRALRLIRQNGNQSVASLMDAILEAGLGAALGLERFAEEANAIQSMRQSLAEADPGGGSIWELGQRLKPADRVEILTIASCKGLEFDYVIALGLDQKKFPFFASLAEPELLAEERRKFYVVLTRAREHVDLLYSGFVQWPRRPQPDRAGPSMFLFEAGLLSKN